MKRDEEAQFTMPHLVNFDSEVEISRSLSIRRKDQIRSRVTGCWEFSPNKVGLYLSKNQLNSSVVRGDDLLRELQGKPVLGIQLLEYLVKHPYCIPGEWLGQIVFFWGTIIRNWDGGLYVHYLFWDGESCYKSYRWLGERWGVDSPAVIALPVNMKPRVSNPDPLDIL